MIRFFGLTLLLASMPCSSAAAQTSTGTARSAGVDIYYHVYGNPHGVPVLILNGGPGVSSEHFASLAERVAALEPGYRVILFDQRGTGRSRLDRVDTSTVTLRLMLHDVEALREHIGIEEWVVMGHSWGGMYAMLYATSHPEHVDGLILSSSGGSDLQWLDYVGANIRMRLGPERRAAYDRALDPDVMAADPAGATRQRIEAMAAAYVYDPDNIPFVVEALSRPDANYPEVRSLVYADLRRTGYDLEYDLARYTAPVLLIHGRQDILGEEVPLRTHEILPNSELLWLNECSHYPWLDRPEAFSSALAGYLARVAGPGD